MEMTMHRSAYAPILSLLLLCSCCCSSTVGIQTFREFGLDEKLRAYEKMRADDCFRGPLPYLYAISEHGCEAAVAVAPRIRTPLPTFGSREAMEVIRFASDRGCDVMTLAVVAEAVRWAAENAPDAETRADARLVLRRWASAGAVPMDRRR
jgi:hypothetical protein